jgi:hypothetical protein
MVKIEPFGQLHEADVVAFETRNGIQLPPDYREFLISHNGGKVISAECFVNPEIQTVAVDAFCGLTGRRGLDIQGWLDEYKSEMPPGFLIIAKDPGGNFFILGTASPTCGVFYWDHTQVFPSSSEDGGNTYNISLTFEQFRNSLRSTADTL